MNISKPAVTRIFGIEVAEDRFVSVNGPPVNRLPGWGMLLETAEVEYHLHPAITYEVHYKVPFYVLVHTFNGARGRFALEEDPVGPWNIDARTTCIVPPNKQVRVIQTAPLEFLGVGIAPDRVDRIAALAGPDWGGLDCLYKTVDPALSALCAEIRRSMIAEPLGTGAYLDSLTDAILARLIGWHLTETSEETEGSETLSPALAKRIARTIEDNLDGPIRVSDLATDAGLSRAHFSRAFAHSLGAPPRDYILSRRIARARTMLTDTDCSASEIAMSCGFASPSHLTTSFRREIGLTPTAYRRAMASGS